MKPPTAASVDFTTREKRRIVAGFIATAVIGVLGVWIGVANSIENGQQNAAAAAANKARDEQTAELLDCFDTLLGRTAIRSTKVGEAAERVTTTTLDRDRAKYRWIALLNRALALNPDEGSDEAIAIGIKFQRRTTELLTAQRAVIAAQLAQERVRDKYPVPPPPSSFCEVDGTPDVLPPIKPTPQTPKPTSKPTERNP